jgi:hypothetical protein
MAESGWHFLCDDGTTESNGLRPVPGETLRYEGPLSVCHSGLHYCSYALDALNYAPSPIVERVEAVGKVVKGKGIYTDKRVTSARKCLWIANATPVLHEFACWCAEQVLQWLQETGREPGKPFWAAIAAKRAWLRGEIASQDLYIAVHTAETILVETANTDGFTWDIVHYTWGAVFNATRVSPSVTCVDAAKNAASYAATALTGGFAWGDAWNAKREIQRQRLDEMLLALAPTSTLTVV